MHPAAEQRVKSIRSHHRFCDSLHHSLFYVSFYVFQPFREECGFLSVIQCLKCHIVFVYHNLAPDNTDSKHDVRCLFSGGKVLKQQHVAIVIFKVSDIK